MTNNEKHFQIGLAVTLSDLFNCEIQLPYWFGKAVNISNMPNNEKQFQIYLAVTLSDLFNCEIHFCIGLVRHKYFRYDE